MAKQAKRKAASVKKQSRAASKKKSTKRLSGGRATAKTTKKRTVRKSVGKSASAKKKTTKKTVARKTAKKAATKKATSKRATSVTKKTARPKAAAKTNPGADRKPRAAGRTKSASPESATSAAAQKPLTKSPLSQKELQQFREVLLVKRAALVGDLSTLSDEARGAGESGGGSTMPLHMADLGTDNFEQEFTLGLLANERERLADIDEALERIAQGTYGICAATGRPISKQRLKAQPWTKYCYEYVLEQERRRGR